MAPGRVDLGISGNRVDWSPDGTKLLYDKYFPAVSSTEIMIANADGSGEARLTENLIYDSAPVWSPDGTMIAYVTQDGGTDGEIATMDAGGTGPRR